MENGKQLQAQAQEPDGSALSAAEQATSSGLPAAGVDRPVTAPVPAREASTPEAAAVRKQQLPQRGPRYALVGGLLMGLLVALVQVILILLNAGLFQQAHQQVAHNALTVSVALSLAAIFGTTWAVALLVALAGGLILGRIAVRRRLGFLAGALGGVVYSLLLWPLSFLPAYPGNLSGPARLDGGSLVLELLWCLFWGLGGALICLFGTWVVSARHPHYRER
jgi:hypothetical protein